MINGQILKENLRHSKMTEADLYGKLREANAFDLRRVYAIEPTGDVSFLHGHGGSNEELSPELLEGTRE